MILSRSKFWSRFRFWSWIRFWSFINIWSWAEVVFNRSWFRHDSRGLEPFFFVKVLFLHIFILPFYFFQENMNYSFDVTRMWMVQRTKNSMTIAGSALFILMYFTSPIHGAGGDCMCKYHWFYISNICNLFVTPKNELTNSKIHEFKVLQDVF